MRKARTYGSVNSIWPLLIFSFGPTPSVSHLPHRGRSEALRRPKGDAFRAKRRPWCGRISNSCCRVGSIPQNNFALGSPRNDDRQLG